MIPNISLQVLSQSPSIHPPPVCGDGNVDPGEECEGNQTQACTTAEWYDGNQECLSDCTFGSCNSPDFCGDSIINGNEFCDSNAQSCTAANGYPGSQDCNVTCTNFETCTSNLFCGDGTCTNPPEDSNSCPSDCFSACGNGICEAGEDSVSCPQDCAPNLIFFDDYTEDINNNPNINWASIQDVSWDDDTNYFPVSVSGGEIQNNYPGLISLWRLNENAGATTFVDSSSNTNDGICSGATCPTSGVPGQLNNAVDFDGTDDYLNIPYNPSLNLTSELTLTAWINPTATDSQDRIIHKREGSSSNDYALFCNADPTESFCYVQFRANSCAGAEQDFGTETSSVGLNEWTHIAATFDDATDTVRLYVNGVNTETSTTFTTAPCNDVDDIEIGGQAGHVRWFDGFIDEVAVFNRALTPIEIADISSGIIGSFESPPIDTSGVYYGLDASWLETASGVNLQITTDNGINWCSVSNGGNLGGTICDPISGASDFRYRINFNSDTFINWVDFNWDPNPPPPQCSDGQDNDGDGAIDFPADFSCLDANDNDESLPLSQCQDGLDNDNDGWIDLIDPGCFDNQDNDESDFVGETECSDQQDNDADGLIDGNDPMCNSPNDVTETAQCQDGIDNDGDTFIDFPADPGCTDVNDNNEFDGLNTECTDGIDNDLDGDIDYGDFGCFGPNGQETMSVQPGEVGIYGYTLFSPTIGSIDPNDDSRIVFVSSTDGNDGTCGFYSKQDIDSLASFNDIVPCRTLSKGKSFMRHTFPDWMLLKRGDVWTNEVFGQWKKAGRSDSEKMLIGSYGTDSRRPLLRTGSQSAIETIGSGSSPNVDNFAFIGLHLFPHTYSGSDKGPIGIFFRLAGENLTFEDSMVEGYRQNTAIAGGILGIQNLKFRRNVIVDAWTEPAIAIGSYFKNVHDVLIEENVFDHNGWQEGNLAAYRHTHNHNLYSSQDTEFPSSNIVVLNNIFSAGSSNGMKGSYVSVVENNLFARNAIGFFTRYTPALVRDNVILDGQDLGPDPITGLPIPRAAGIQILSVDFGQTVVEDNIIANKELQFGNGAAFGPQPLNVNTGTWTIRNNIVWKWRGKGIQTSGSGTGKTYNGMSFDANTFVIFLPSDEKNIMVLWADSDIYTPLPGLFTNNRYYSAGTNGPDDWFLSQPPNVWRTFTEWLAYSGETGATKLTATEAQNLYPDPDRTVASYHASIGGVATHEAFIAEARQQSKSNWLREYTAGAVNDYIREGFQVTGP